MARSIVLSNGTLCVALDACARVRDIYFPHVGQEDHVRGHYIHRVGVWIDGRMSWLGEDDAWKIEVGCAQDALASDILARHPDLGVELTFTDVVYNERPVFVRRVAVKNTADRQRDVKLFFAHQFEIGKTHGGETAYYDPERHAILHYKGKRVFLVYAEIDTVPFDDYATGRQGFQEKEGTHRDADDGMLSKNPIEHGQVDSAIGLTAQYAAGQSRVVRYWIAAAQSIDEVSALAAYVSVRTPEHLIRSTVDYWRAWLAAVELHFHGLAPEHETLFRRSLLYVRAHVDQGGGILASVDSDMLRYAFDTYGYVWPRDAAYAALALDASGDVNVSRRFFEFASTLISEGGFFWHKYLPDASRGSSWHPFLLNGRPQLPIQEDETALVLYALCEHFRCSRDLEFIEGVYQSLIERPADFLLSYRDPQTKLPLPSYNLWERQRGVFTFTAGAVYGALAAAADMSKILGKVAHTEHYTTAAEEIRQGILAHLWDAERGIFLNCLAPSETGVAPDRTIDMSSAYGVWRFGVLPADDERLVRAFETSIWVLSQGIGQGGIARFEGDEYYRERPEAAGNPWIITTLWYAEYLIARARTEADLNRARGIFDWVARHAADSGVLPEQIHAQTGAPLSAMPLMWSHAAYVSAVLAYLNRHRDLGLCADCKPTD